MLTLLSLRIPTGLFFLLCFIKKITFIGLNSLNFLVVTGPFRTMIFPLYFSTFSHVPKRPPCLTEFRIAALVAAKLENVKSMTDYSYPVQTSFASSPEFSGGVKKVLKEYGLPEINSVLEIFDWAELKIVPSSYDLEPINDSSAIFTGPFSKPCLKQTMPEKRKKIIAYFGTGTISGKKVVETLTEAFYYTDTELC